MRSFAFFWRLVKEKGFDLLLPFFHSAIVSRTARIAVFGEGELKDDFLARFSGRAGFCDFRKVPDDACAARFANLPSGTVAYFWRRPFAVISATLAHCDVSLMPSTFLETFGLSALESLSKGVPVAGFSKGGIVPFLTDEPLRLPENSDFLRSLEILAHASDGKVAEWKASASSVAEKYSEAAFLERLRKLFPENAKNVLLATDFVGNIGGIESYVKNLSDTLVSAGFEVRTVGKSDGFSSRFQKIVSTFAAFAHFPARGELSDAMRDFRPDVVWCHSVLRRFWPVGLDGAFATDAFRIMTYHDLGYFAPFAASCEKESDVPLPGIFPFLAKARGLPRKAFAFLKYFKLRSLFRRLARFDLHLVPSPFMLPYVRDRLGPDARIEALPHYVVPPCKP